MVIQYSANEEIMVRDVMQISDDDDIERDESQNDVEIITVEITE